MSDPDLNHARQALAMLDHLVVQDLFLTETAFHADVVLPASAFAEKSGTFTNTDRRVQIGTPVLPPPGDARRTCGSFRRSPSVWGSTGITPGPRKSSPSWQRTMPSFNNITWERVVREGSVTYPVDSANVPGNDIIFVDGFPTANGRAKIVRPISDRRMKCRTWTSR